MLAVDQYYKKTTILFKEYDQLTDRDYLHITGKNTGCWSYVGRQGGVSSIMQGVVNPLNAELKPIRQPLALLGVHHILHVTGIRVKKSPEL